MCVRLGKDNCNVCETKNGRIHDPMCVGVMTGKCTHNVICRITTLWDCYSTCDQLILPRCGFVNANVELVG